uniref:Cytochrome c oxidase assembly protein COX19 n=1 Tax=Callorhinchus milii TaxID=7868 RepID=A0A4W3IF88_CALMI
MTPHGKHRLREILTDKLFCSFVFAGECKTIKEKFMKCLRENKFDNSLCREVSKEYLECRMDRQLMTKEPLEKLGFKDLVDRKATETEQAKS